MISSRKPIADGFTITERFVVHVPAYNGGGIAFEVFHDGDKGWG